MDARSMKYMEEAGRKDCEVCIWGAGYIGTQFGLPLLKKRRIAADYFCDNNSSLWGQEIAEGIRCISPGELKEKADRVVCFLMVGVLYCDEVLAQINDMGIKRIVTYNDLIQEETINYFPFMRRKQIAVYTCIVGDYDDLQEPLSISPECDYFLISDRKPERNTVFEYIDIETVVPKHLTDNTRKNRFCKINAHKIFHQYRYSVYFDGNIRLKHTITELIAELPGTRLITLCPNHWSSIYREMVSILQNGRDDGEVVRKQAEKYWLEGLPENFGCVICAVLIREHNHPVCRRIMEEWWQQLEQFSRRDQISLPYVLWRNGYSISDIGVIAEKYDYVNGGKYWAFQKEHKIPRIDRQKAERLVSDYR